jgi:2,3-bisphosphoglycerate-independent phosphoglycerate mutase
MVSAAPWALGMAAVAGMKTLDAAEDRPQALARAAFEALAAADLVVVHTEAPARASHHGDVREKLEALAHWDRQLVGPVADEIARTGGVLLVAVTSTALAERRVNRDGPTPFLLHGRDVSAPVAPRAFTEAAAGESQLRASGAAALLEHFHRS